MSIRVLLADDHVLVRQALRSILEREGFVVTGEASDGHEAVRLAEAQKPEVAILDLAMPLLNGIDAAREILRTCPDTSVILLTMHHDDQYVLEALRAGITGYVLKTRAAADLVHGIGEVARGGLYLSSGLSRDALRLFLEKREVLPDPLTPRERQLLQLVAEGKTTKEAAAVLGISVKTADTHRARIMKKLGVQGTAGLVRYAIRTGLIQP